MAKYRVLMTTTASRWAEVDVPDDLTDEAAREYAIDNVDGFVNLCAHCSSNVDLGDFEVPDRDTDDVTARVDGDE